MKPQRLILAINAAGLSDNLSETGFFPMDFKCALESLYTAGLWIGPREALELNPAFKQIIPYVILQVGDKFVRYVRTPTGGEARLHGRTSIGLGGHIDLADIIFENNSIDLEKTLSAAAAREVAEELGDITCLEKRTLGIIIENSSDVGRVHIGFAELWRISGISQITVEDAIGEVQLTTIENLRSDKSRLETWSALLLENLTAATVN